MEVLFMTYADCLEEMCSGTNHLFIMAGGGYGKSYLIKQMQERGIPNVLYLAPTGLAALNINGITIHAAFSLKPSVAIETEYHSTDVDRYNILKSTDTVLIDEISMVRADTFDAMDRLLRSIMKSDLPFGGKRIIFVGDIFQLQPIATATDTPYLKKMYPTSSSYNFFNSTIFQNPFFLNNLLIVELTHNFRQTEDTLFAFALKNIRVGENLDDICSIINLRQFDYPKTTCQVLTTTRKLASDYNDMMLLSLPDKPFYSMPDIKPLYMSTSESVLMSPMAKPLTVKNNMQIIFVTNDSLANGQRWVNGTTARIIDEIYSSDSDIESVIVDIDGEQIEVFRETIQIFRPSFNKEKQIVEIIVVATITQFPFIASWATTIHKQQGQTIPGDIIINLGNIAFAAGQTYVALSRVKTINNIYLSRPIDKRDIIVSDSTKLFYKSISPQIVPITL
jgi:hypothetical protein